MTAQVNINPAIFRRSDIRGLYPQELNLETAKIIGQAINTWLQNDLETADPITVAIGRDVRVSSGELFTGLAEGIMNSGGNVVDLDLIGTEIISFASTNLDVDAVVMVSASHNPKEFNGFKIVKRGAVPVAFDSGLYSIRDLAMSIPKSQPDGSPKGSVTRSGVVGLWSEYIKGLISIIKIKPLKVVLDAGNGMGGMMLEFLLPVLPVKVTKLFFEPDGDFPNHIPNPMLKENLSAVIAQVKNQKADLGVAFDGDADRAIFIDKSGRPINCSVIGALIADFELGKNPGATILYNAVIGKIMPETVAIRGGKPVRTMVGHSVIQEKMRSLNAVFAAEHSGHYYFRDYFGADSSMVTLLRVLEILSATGKTLSELSKPYDVYPQSGEINFEFSDKEKIMSETRKHYLFTSRSYDDLDGLSLWYDDWWFNLRPSQNEDLIRLNIEANTQEQLDSQTSRLTSFILSLGAKPYIPY